MSYAEGGELRLPLTLRREHARMATGQHRARVLAKGQHDAADGAAAIAGETIGAQTELAENLAVPDVDPVESADGERNRSVRPVRRPRPEPTSWW